VTRGLYIGGLDIRPSACLPGVGPLLRKVAARGPSGGPSPSLPSVGPPSREVAARRPSGGLSPSLPALRLRATFHRPYLAVHCRRLHNPGRISISAAISRPSLTPGSSYDARPDQAERKEIRLRRNDPGAGPGPAPLVPRRGAVGCVTPCGITESPRDFTFTFTTYRFRYLTIGTRPSSRALDLPAELPLVGAPLLYPSRAPKKRAVHTPLPPPVASGNEGGR